MEATASAIPRRHGLRRSATDVIRMPTVAAAAALLLPLAAAAALIPFRGWLTTANVALVLVLVVVAVAMIGGRVPAVVAALGSTLWFDVFHTRPYFSVTISRHQDIVTAVLLLLVGLAVGDLSTRARRHQAKADLGSMDIGRLHQFAELVAGGEDADFVTLAAASELRNLLDLRDVRFELAPFGEPPAKPRPRIERDGSVSFGVLPWGAGSIGLPGKQVELPVLGRGQELGRFVLEPTPGHPLDLDRRRVAVALADHVGAAMAGSPAA